VTPVGRRPRGRRSLALLGLFALLAGAPPADSQVREVHGEDSVFADTGIVIVWGVLQGPTDEQTQVVISVAADPDVYSHVWFDEVDPFANTRRSSPPEGPISLSARPETVEVRNPRSTFSEFPRREFRFFRAGQAHVVVYYLGVPDTTPEFTSEPALRAYLAHALARARRQPPGRTP
jgi:hypothetical protein